MRTTRRAPAPRGVPQDDASQPDELARVERGAEAALVALRLSHIVVGSLELRGRSGRESLKRRVARRARPEPRFVHEKGGKQL